MPISKASGQAVAPAAKGDLVVGSATNDAAVLGVGSADQVLTVDSSTTTGLKWATPAAGGMTLINTGGTTLTGASVTISSIPSGYVNLVLIIRDFLPATDGAELMCRINADSNTRYEYFPTSSTTNGGNPVPFGSTYINVADGDNAVTEGLSYIEFFDYSNTVTWKTGRFQSLSVDQTTNTYFRSYNGTWVYNQTGAITSLVFAATSGNMTSGTAFLYGVK